MLSCRLLPFADAGAAQNMAADEALLHTAAEGVASLRFYTWTEPTLSLGYFQAAAPARGLPRLGQLSWVRRPSGGAALVHHYELTYALALPPASPWQYRDRPWLPRMHRIVQAALAACGVATQLCPAEAERGQGEALCFLHHTANDLLIAHSKICGSAQRKHRGALLQHGSILLACSPATPQLPGIAELTGKRLTLEEVQATLTELLAHHTGWTIVSSHWTAGENQRMTTLAEQKYASQAWNARR